MSFEIEGKTHKVFDTESKSEKFQAREFVIETDGQYPQYIKFQLTQDKCNLVDNIKEGDMIKVYFDLRGREWNEKYFTNLNAWRVEAATKQAAVAPPPAGDFPSEEYPAASPAQTSGAAEDFDDLPF